MATPTFTTPPAAATTGSAAGLADPAAWVDEYGDYLFRFALARVRNESVAEDLAQETFLAALKSGGQFEGRAAPKSWLAGILKNKLLDHFHRAARETAFTDLEFLRDEQADRFIPDGLFKDGWIHELGPEEWGVAPGTAHDQEQFWSAFHECTGKLPQNSARVFLLREVDDLSTDEIAAALNLTPNHLWVMLHRARMALRRCLEANWIPRIGGRP